MSSSRRHPDHRSPFVVEIHDLQRRAGTMKELHREALAPQGLEVGMIAVPEGSPIGLDLRMEAVVEGVLVSGGADVSLHGVCSRCLNEFDLDDTFDFQELFFYPGREADEDAYWVEEESVDLEGVLRDAVVLELPFTPLCRDDCSGLCPECGANLNNDPGHGHGDQVDPRWANLASLTGEPQDS